MEKDSRTKKAKFNYFKLFSPWDKRESQENCMRDEDGDAGKPRTVTPDKSKIKIVRTHVSMCLVACQPDRS